MTFRIKDSWIEHSVCFCKLWQRIKLFDINLFSCHLYQSIDMLRDQKKIKQIPLKPQLLLFHKLLKWSLFWPVSFLSYQIFKTCSEYLNLFMYKSANKVNITHSYTDWGHRMSSEGDARRTAGHGFGGTRGEETQTLLQKWWDGTSRTVTSEILSARTSGISRQEKAT